MAVKNAKDALTRLDLTASVRCRRPRTTAPFRRPTLQPATRMSKLRILRTLAKLHRERGRGSFEASINIANHPQGGSATIASNRAGCRHSATAHWFPQQGITQTSGFPVVTRRHYRGAQASSVQRTRCFSCEKFFGTRLASDVLVFRDRRIFRLRSSQTQHQVRETKCSNSGTPAFAPSVAVRYVVYTDGLSIDCSAEADTAFSASGRSVTGQAICQSRAPIRHGLAYSRDLSLVPSLSLLPAWHLVFSPYARRGSQTPR